MNWISEGSDRAAVISAVPAIAGAFDALYQSLAQQTCIDRGVLELCRLRLAAMHDSALDWQRNEHPVPKEKRSALRQGSNNDLFTKAERACLEFTEIYAQDAQALTDQLADAVKLHFGDAGLVVLIEALGIFDGMTRLSLLWQLPIAEHAQENN